MRKLIGFLNDTEQFGVVVPREEHSIADESNAHKLKGMTIADASMTTNVN